MSSVPNTIIRRANLSEIIDLRHSVLRANLPRDEAIFVGDELRTSRHYGAFTQGDARAETVGCATLHLNQWENQPAWQLRGMATAIGFRNTGLGRKLLELAEHDITSDPQASKILWCNARVPALGFYQKMGWHVVSEEFLIPTAGPHVKMLRHL